MNCHYLILWSVCGVLCVQQRLFWYVVCCECSNDYFGVWCAINAAMIILVCGVLWVQRRLFRYVVCYECRNDYFGVWCAMSAATIILSFFLYTINLQQKGHKFWHLFLKPFQLLQSIFFLSARERIISTSKQSFLCIYYLGLGKFWLNKKPYHHRIKYNFECLSLRLYSVRWLQLLLPECW